MLLIQEHGKIENIEKNERYDRLSLVSWTKLPDNDNWGYYASYKIGAEWIDQKESLVVTPKRGM